MSFSTKITVVALFCLVTAQPAFSGGGPQGKDFGFGIIIGEPLGLTGKYWLNNENALVFDVGASYFGAPRIIVDYLWHMNVFNSSVVTLYAGPGGSIGFGNEASGFLYKKGRNYWYYRDDAFGASVRVIVGLNIIPKRTPLEIFVELGPNIGIVPGFGAALDGAVGIRFYP
jgi:hypothetical protein